jgi:hypothetical protein
MREGANALSGIGHTFNSRHEICVLESATRWKRLAVCFLYSTNMNRLCELAQRTRRSPEPRLHYHIGCERLLKPYLASLWVGNLIATSVSVSTDVQAQRAHAGLALSRACTSVNQEPIFRCLMLTCQFTGGGHVPTGVTCKAHVVTNVHRRGPLLAVRFQPWVRLVHHGCSLSNSKADLC